MQKIEKKVLGLVLLTAVLVGVLMFVLRWQAQTKKVNQNNSKPIAKLTQIEKDKLPDKFPAEIPVEANAEITLNFNAINLSGKFQSTREFISSKSIEDNFILYLDILKKEGWVVGQKIDDTAKNQKIILASKGEEQLNIRIYTDVGDVKVAISSETLP